MVIGNIFYDLGDSAEIISEAIWGVQSITDIRALALNGTIPVPFSVMFSYSQSSETGPFTTPTPVILPFTPLPLDPAQPVYLKFTITRVDNGVDFLIFDKMQMCFEYEAKTCDKMVAHQHSVFYDIYCKNIEQVKYCDALFHKLYNYSIVPKYFTRQDDSLTLGLDDKDYISFWKAVACYFSLLVMQARKLSQIKYRAPYASFYLENRGLFLCGGESLDILQYLIDHIYDEFRQRGTNNIFKVHTRGSGVNEKNINGELLRILCKAPCDEFIYHLFKRERLGWCMNQSSPLYRSLFGEDEVAKITAPLISVPALQNDFVVTINGLTSGVNGGIVIDAPSGPSYAGFTYIENLLTPSDFPTTPHDLNASELSKSYVVDPYLDYEVTFEMTQNFVATPDDPLSGLTFGAYAVDCDGRYVGLESCKSVAGSSPINFFCETQAMARNYTNVDTYRYLIRGIIFAVGTPIRSGADAKLDFDTHPTPESRHLRFKKEVSRILPILVNENKGTAFFDTFEIYNLQIRPLATCFSRGFVQTPNFLNIWMKNNDKTHDFDEITDITRHYLIPYNTVLHTQELGTVKVNPTYTGYVSKDPLKPALLNLPLITNP